MSVQVTTAFSQQFSTNVTLLAQQLGTKLRGAVREESITGEKAFGRAPLFSNGQAIIG